MKPLAVAGAIPWLVLSLAGSARADGLCVIAAGDAGTERASVAAAVVAAIGARGRVVADAVGEARARQAAGAVPVTMLARFREVQAMIDEGWRAYLRAQLDFAQSRLAAARIAAEPLVAWPGGAELYADAALRLGAVLQHRRIAEAPSVIALALALDPARPVTLAEFSPDVVDAVAAVRAQPAAIQRLHVTSVPDGAAIAIDGHELGAAPLDAEVTRGQHLVIGRAPGARPVVQGVNVDGRAAVALPLELDDDAARLAAGAAPGLSPLFEQALIDAALIYGELDEVVIAAVGERRGGPALFVQRCAGAPARCSAVAEVGFGDRAGLAAAAREAWQAVAGAAAMTAAPSVLGTTEPRVPDHRCHLCRNPYVWAGAGAAAIAATLAILALSGTRPPPVLNVDGRGFGK
ncbi:MAG TPA: PEGA domain-containing protein [Kofleriaceae bacterium]